MKKVLVVIAHPDDEVLGCGGTIAKHTATGDEVRIVSIADGEQSRNVARKLNRDDKLEASRVVLGASSCKAFNLKDNQLDSYPLLEIVKLIEIEVANFLPQVVYTHSLTDLNVDHQVVHKAVVTSCRGLPGRSVKKILSFEVPSSTEWQSCEAEVFKPDYFVDITKYYSKKIEGLNVYRNEMRDFPHPRSFEYVDSLAKIRGAQVGVKKAEAFKVIRILE